MPEPRYLLVRPEDLVVLGAAWTGCTVEGATLRASGPDAVLAVTFPPQAVAESKERGASGVLRGRQSGTGTVLVALEPGAQVALTVEGLLAAVAAARVVGGAVEIPFGLTMDVARVAADTRLRHQGPPRTSPAGGHALWQTRVVSAGPMTYAATDAGMDDTDMDVAPLARGDRGQIAASGPARLDRLALSPLGGTLSAHLANDTFEWDHDMALGRDRRVRVLRHGVLYPYGHRAVVLQVAERTVEGGVAALRTREVLTVTEPVRALPDDGTEAARTFPFHEVELLTTSLEGFELPWTAVQPPSERTIGVRAELAVAEELTAQAQAAFDAWTPVLGIDDLVNRGDTEAGRLRDVLWPEMTRLEQAIADAESVPEPLPEPTGPEPDPVFLSPDELAGSIQPEATFAPPPAASGGGSFAVAQALREQLAQLQVEARPIEDRVDAEVRRGHELNALGRDVGALAGAGVFEAQALLQRQADELPIEARIAEMERAINLLFVPSRGDEPVPFRVRCAGALGDVTFETPVVFVSDFTLPPEGDFFGGYRSLADPALPSMVSDALGGPLLDAQLPGTRVDVVRSPAPATADVQQVHAMRLRAEQRGTSVRPVVEDFTVELPELRALLPDPPVRVPLRYSDAFREGSATDTALAFVAAVPVSFDGRAERGGGVLTPTFDADAISRTFGPVDRRAVEGGAAAAFAKMTLLGVELPKLLPDAAPPPEIVQLLPPGGPAGVRMSWTGQRLRSNGAFRAHRPDDELDTTTLDLVVEQSGEKRSTRCALGAFTLSLPEPGTELLAVAFAGLVFTQADGQAPKVEVSSPDVRFSGALTLLQGLRDAIDLGGSLPALRSVPDGVTVSYALHVPDATAGAFLLRNIAVRAAVDVPFRGGLPSVSLAFASKADPFHLQVSLFGGGGYLDVLLDASGVRRFEASLDFGAVIAVDFGIVSAEVHALGGVRFAIEGSKAEATAFLSIGGSIELFGLVSVSVSLVVELRFESAPRPRLVGRATLVIEVDLTLYADSVELDSGEWEFLGGSGPAVEAAPPDEAAQRADWERYQGAYA